MEKILKIEEVKSEPSADGSWCDGYEVTTDKQVVKMYITNEQSCCESWGYFMTEDDLQKFVGADLLDVQLTDICLNKKRLEEADLYSDNVMFVNVNTSVGTLQFVAYNDHDGYYGHSAYVYSEQLNHEGIL